MSCMQSDAAAAKAMEYMERDELRGPLQKAYEVGSSIIICFRKVQDVPYKCYKDSVLCNRSQKAQIRPSILLRKDMS